MTNEKAFLLSYIKYGDSNAIIHCFTENNGYESFFVKNIFNPKNKKKAYLQPLNHLLLTADRSGRKPNSIRNISKIELVKNYNFHSNIKSSSILFFIADFLNIILKNENEQKKIYEEILTFTQELEQNNFRSHIIFLLKTLQIQGFLPLISDKNYLNPETGEFENEQNHKVFTKEISAFWKSIIISEKPYQEKVNKDLMESIMLYYHYHFPDFKTPISLKILQEIFA